MRALVIGLVAVMATAAGVPAWSEDGPVDNGQDHEDGKVLASYDDGFKLVTADQRFMLLLNAGIQLRYTYMDFDPEIRGNEGDYSNFYIRRARLWWRGYVFDPRITYFFNVQLEPTRTVNAHDLWISYRFSNWLNLGAGRNKIAYGLGMLNSGWGLQFVERSVMYGETDIDSRGLEDSGPVYPGGGTERFGLYWESPDTGFATGGMNLYRSQGVQLSGASRSLAGSTFEYQAGVWNGRGTTGLSNNDDSMLYALRVGYHPWGWIDWLRQGDGLHSTRFMLAVLVSGYWNSSSTGGGYDESGCNLALMSRYRGFSADFEWGAETFDYAEFEDDFEREGWKVDVGYFVSRGTLQAVARYAQIERLKDPSYAASMSSGLGVAEVADGSGGYRIGIERRISEVTVGFNWFINDWQQHALKLDASRLEREFAADPGAVIDGQPTPIARAPTQVDYRVRAMVQLYF
jgi:hypothetical protein